MGGLGSGRSKNRPRTHHFRSVDMAKLSPAQADAVRRQSSVGLCYGAKDALGHQVKVEAHIGLSETATAFGGARKWFVCPSCKGRSRVLYLRAVGPKCRKCCRAQYASQSESPKWRELSRAQAIRMRLGGTGNMLDDFPCKPKGMHWRTYDALRNRHEHLAGLHFGQLSQLMGLAA